jgi:DNA repair exonuclease SbcCD ATPase subunit
MIRERIVQAIDPFRSYAELAKWLGILIIAAALVVGGCRHGEKEQAQDDAETIRKAQDEAAGHKAQVAILAQRLAEIDSETAEAARLAEERKREADEAAKRAVLQAQALKKELAEIDADIAKAKRDPDCRRMMEARSCALLK